MVRTDHLTQRQRDVYVFIRDKIHSRGYGPTVREIAQQFQIRSPNFNKTPSSANSLMPVTVDNIRP